MSISTISSKPESQVSEALRLQHLPKNCFSRISNYFSRIFGFLDPCELGSVERVNSSRQRMIALHVQDLPKDCFSHIFSFLDPRELASAEQVNHTWKGMIGSQDQVVWKKQCRIQNVIVVSPVERIVEQTLGSYSSKEVVHRLHRRFNSPLLSIITSYDACDERSMAYKKSAIAIHGKVSLAFCGIGITLSNKNWITPDLRWGSSKNEPFVQAQVYSSESVAACRTHHENCTNSGKQETWEDIHPRFHAFPGRFPLRFFINRDGHYKQDGDTITLCYEKKLVILTCIHPSGGASSGARTFADDLADRVRRSVISQTIETKDVTKAKIAAQTTPDWIGPD